MRSWDEYKTTMREEDTLWASAREGDRARLGFFLERGDDINALDHRGYSPLMLACYAGHAEAAQYLIAKGADVNSTDAAGNSILMGVCFKGYADLAQLLIQSGASVHLRNHAGQEARDIAASFGRDAIVRILAQVA